MEIVDAQIHLWTADTAPPHHRQTPFRIEQALREMDAAGVARAVNCPAVWDPDANAYAVEAATRYPDRFATLGWFDLKREPNADFVATFVAQPGMLGLRFLLFTPEQQAMFVDGRLDWIWQAADARGLPVGLMLPPTLYTALAATARRYPRVRWLIDHLGAPPFGKLPEAAVHLNGLLALAAEPTIAVKATGVPSIASDGYPFASVGPVLHRVFDAFGPQRMLWGSDITRLSCSWRECVTLFTEELPWLQGDDLASVMGGAVRAWIGWT